MVKKLFDFLLALLLLLIFLPLIVLIILIIKINMGSPVFFVQKRPGYKTKPFYLIKFRTMNNIDEKNQSDFNRITRLGKFLRATSLDELPEVLNVIRGEMSIVGPRPLLMEYLPLYTKEQMKRHDVLPGITGLSQVNGRNQLPWEKRFELDLYYVRNHSFFLDLKIFITTIFKVIFLRGINQSSKITSEKFRGNADND